MYTPSDFQSALLRHKKITKYCIHPDWICDKKDIDNLSDAFLKKYGFRLPEVDIFQIWKWHSNEWDASFLIVRDAEKEMEYFDQFVDVFHSK